MKHLLGAGKTSVFTSVLTRVMASLLIVAGMSATSDAFARNTRQHSKAVIKNYHPSKSRRTTSRVTARATSKGKSKRAVASKRGHKVHHVAHAAPKTRYAYPIGIFMARPPAFDSSPLDSQAAERVVDAFNRGNADSYAARILVRAGLVKYHPLRGGIFWRREPVKYIIVHSTETGIPIGAVRVIESWSSMGIRHPGAQYVVDRDGTIVQAVDPDLATVHINIFKTLPGINNDNSIGIEMCHAGAQDYPQELRQSVIKLITYLQNRYNIDDANVITHRYAQQGDHTDPVRFDFEQFIATKNQFKNQAIAYRTGKITQESRSWRANPEPQINTYLKLHNKVSEPVGSTTTPVPAQEVLPSGNSSAGKLPVGKLAPAPQVQSLDELNTQPAIDKKPATPSIDAPAPMPVPASPVSVPAPSTVTPPANLAPASPAPAAPVEGEGKPQASIFVPAQAMLKHKQFVPVDTTTSIKYYPPGYFNHQAQTKTIKNY
ncbi:MAG: N-acetylmuramoyl-L-alanine amidase [Candidatus Obscuribacter sp.]|nr:N-acetylmuramoyl-L-alanine amidase [Candidatus Obscuribacter sp.]